MKVRLTRVYEFDTDDFVVLGEEGFEPTPSDPSKFIEWFEEFGDVHDFMIMQKVEDAS